MRARNVISSSVESGPLTLIHTCEFDLELESFYVKWTTFATGQDRVELSMSSDDPGFECSLYLVDRFTINPSGPIRSWACTDNHWRFSKNDTILFFAENVFNGSAFVKLYYRQVD